MKKFFALLLSLCMILSLAACGGNNDQPTSTPDAPKQDTPDPAEDNKTPDPEPAAEEDTIVIMAPPVTGDYADLLAGWIADFQKEYPHLKVEVISTAWDDHSSKLSTMALSGEAPDIAEVSYGAIGTYVEMGVAMDVRPYLPEGALEDYDQNALDYMTLDNTVYGLPLYLTIQALGGNRQMMTEAGVDVDKIQAQGWTYDEFLKAIEAGTKDDTYGFVFANAAVATGDFVSIFGVGAGITANFTKDLKYAYTSENMKTLLSSVETMVSSGWMPNYAVEAGQRLVMLQTGNAMITGKAMPLFENNINKNNAGIATGEAVEGSIEVEYAFLPVPTMDGVTESCFGTVDGMIMLRNNNSTEEHLKNVGLFLNYVCSGQRAADTVNQILLACVCQSGRDAQAGADLGQDPRNAEASTRCIGMVQAPPTGVTSEQAANAKTLMDETIIPKFQALLAGEISAQAMYDEVCARAFDLFGQDGCETGVIK